MAIPTAYAFMPPKHLFDGITMFAIPSVRVKGAGNRTLDNKGSMKRSDNRKYTHSVPIPVTTIVRPIILNEYPASCAPIRISSLR
jgi:hypothetical protein